MLTVRVLAMWLEALKRKAEAIEDAPKAKRILERRHTPLMEPDTPFKVSSADFSKGHSVLPQYVGNAVRTAIKTSGRPHGKGVIRCASICTGSAGDAIALDALQTALQAEGIDVVFDNLFYCEKHDRKRDYWCKKVHQVLSGKADEKYLPCAFHDCEVLGTIKAKCTMHTKQSTPCTLPSHIGLLIAGFSCKDFSRAIMYKGVLKARISSMRYILLAVAPKRCPQS